MFSIDSSLPSLSSFSDFISFFSSLSLIIFSSEFVLIIFSSELVLIILEFAFVSLLFISESELILIEFLDFSFSNMCVSNILYCSRNKSAHLNALNLTLFSSCLLFSHFCIIISKILTFSRHFVPKCWIINRKWKFGD